MQITPNTLTLSRLLGQESEQYVIPAYQRRYSWHEKQVVELLDDIKLLDAGDAHLLGTIVCLTEPHTAGINRLELVDGQQRLTTVFIVLHCLLERLRALGNERRAQDVSRLLTASPPTGQEQPKIVLDSLDAASMNRLLRNELDNANADLLRAFQVSRERVQEMGAEAAADFAYRLMNRAFIIRLDVSEAKDAFKLFETINNRGLRLSAADIVKNFLLGNAARFGPAHLIVARDKWARVITSLDGLHAESFLRHFLISRLKSRITKSYVIATFKRMFMRGVDEAQELPDRRWYLDDDDGDETEEALEEGAETIDETADENGDSPIDALTEGASQERLSFFAFMDELVKAAEQYSMVVQGRTEDASINRRLRNLSLIKAMQTYGFLLRLRMGGCSNRDFERVLELTEGFLLRRHVCKMRSNETERAFARLCSVDCSNPVPEVQAVYRQFSPADERFRDAFAGMAFVPALMDRARYCLERIEENRGGAYGELQVSGPAEVHVEHIIPQRIKSKKAKAREGDWLTYLGGGAEAQHPRYVARIGNLTLFSGTLNIVASNNPYERKKEGYLKSALKITNSLPAEYPEFRFAEVEARSKRLADEAVVLWPIP